MALDRIWSYHIIWYHETNLYESVIGCGCGCLWSALLKNGSILVSHSEIMTSARRSKASACTLYPESFITIYSYTYAI
jgi:hypothetical protein